MKTAFCICSFIAIGFAWPISAATYHIDPSKGSDANAGTSDAPFKSTTKGINVACPGDTVIVNKVDFPIQESLLIKNKSGQPGCPITVDGGGNVFSGCDPIKPEDWKEVRPGVYRNDHLIPELKPGEANNDFILCRYFMLFDGNQNRMGRSSKGGFSSPFVSVEKLKTGEWTYVATEGAFYVAVDTKKKLADCHIDTGVRLNGVSIAGYCEHLVIRNIHVTHFINDGFNIHGQVRDVVFENISAIECGDDGISAHEKCEITIRGCVARRNSTGMTHIDSSISTSDHLVLEDNYAFNLLLVGNGTHIITSSTISAIAPVDGNGGIRLKNLPPVGSDTPLSVKIVDCQIPFPRDLRSLKMSPFIVDEGVKLEVSENTKLDGQIVRVPGKK